jgi:tRNA pseudouridine55 synthase
MDGFILIDTPAGITSHDVVDRLRKITGIRRIGHAGTLDPFATGLLILGIGKATKGLGGLSAKEKEYVGTIVFGATSDTQDGTGTLTPTPDASMPGSRKLAEVLGRFVGTLEQTPPMYSAKKIGGKKLYELARAGETVERKPAVVTVHELALLSYEEPRTTVRVRVSSGTYIRTLAHDIGAALGCGAYLESLRRTAIGPHRVEQAAKLDELTPENWTSRLFR